MLAPMTALLSDARRGAYAVGAFNVYNLEGALAVAEAAESTRSPAIIALLPSAVEQGGLPLTALCLAAAKEASVPMAVHLDHGPSPNHIRAALAGGFTSVMADGSHLSLADNVAFTREMATLAHARNAAIEGELGRLSGTEGGSVVTEREARLTDPEQAAEFVDSTGVDALAVCVGNVHGRYLVEPRLDFERLAAIKKAVPVPLVLHGASGLPGTAVRRSIELGVSKFNVNIEVRGAYLRSLEEQLHRSPRADLPELMQAATAAMRAVVDSKLRLFGSAGRA